MLNAISTDGKLDGLPAAWSWAGPLIADSMRGGLLQQLPDGTPLVVFARETAFWSAATAGRTSATAFPIDASSIPAISGAVAIVDGLDALPDAGAFLRAVRAAGAVRIFALVANGAGSQTVLRALTGAPLPAPYPLTASQLPDVFDRGGWRVLDVIPMVDASISGRQLPYSLRTAEVQVIVTSPERAQLLGTHGYLVVADPQ